MFGICAVCSHSFCFSFPTKFCFITCKRLGNKLYFNGDDCLLSILRCFIPPSPEDLLIQEKFFFIYYTTSTTTTTSTTIRPLLVQFLLLLYLFPPHYMKIHQFKSARFSSWKFEQTWPEFLEMHGWLFLATSEFSHRRETKHIRGS